MAALVAIGPRLQRLRSRSCTAQPRQIKLFPQLTPEYAAALYIEDVHAPHCADWVALVSRGGWSNSSASSSAMIGELAQQLFGDPVHTGRPSG